MSQIEVMAWLAAGYGVLLLGIAYAIDLLARRAHHRLIGDRSGGFVYHENHDAWLCPEDQWLYPQSFDPENRVMRYRGLPLVCNACPVKDTCTASNDGREMRRAVDPWPASEAARFHRGIACAVSVIAVIWPALTALVVTTWPSQVLVLGVAVLVAGASLPLWSHLRHSPADPMGAVVRTLDQTLADREAAAAALARRRSSYASDRREIDAN